MKRAERLIHQLQTMSYLCSVGTKNSGGKETGTVLPAGSPFRRNVTVHVQFSVVSHTACACLCVCLCTDNVLNSMFCVEHRHHNCWHSSSSSFSWCTECFWSLGTIKPTAINVAKNAMPHQMLQEQIFQLLCYCNNSNSIKHCTTPSRDH